MSHRHHPGVVPAVAVVLALTACGPAASTGDASSSAAASPTVLREPTPDARTATACASVMAALPRTVDGLSRDSLTQYTAQWGGSTVTLRCGVPRPAALAADSRCDEVDDIGWFTQQDARHYTFTTIGRAGYVEVTVLLSHQPAANALVDLSSAVARMPDERPCV